MAYDAMGRELGRSSLHTAGEETVLRAESEEKQVRPGGLCFINLTYTDSQGTVKPLERGRIRVKVENGHLLALGNACPYNADGYLSDETETYWGRAMAVVRADRSGPVRLTAEDGRYTA